MTEQPISLPVSAGAIHGTLCLPDDVVHPPVVVIVAGSGPTNRDGNSAYTQNDALRLLAHGLAGCGVASVRYDKRGVGESRCLVQSESDLRFEQYVQDAWEWVQLLSGDERFSSVLLCGHSEGALIGAVAALSCPASAFISLAGMGQGMGQLLRTQLKPTLSDALYRASERILGKLEQGITDDDVPPELAPLYRPGVQPYMVSCLGYQPAQVYSALALPVLIVQGYSDIQVSADNALLLHHALPTARLELINGMNHVLKTVSDDIGQQQTYHDPSIPLSTGLLLGIQRFVDALPE